MSKIKLSKGGGVIWRSSAIMEKGRAICVGLEPECVCVRLAGCHGVLRVPIGLIYTLACRAEADSAITHRHRHTVRRGVLALR